MKSVIWTLAVLFAMGITTATISCNSASDNVRPKTDTVVIDNMEFQPAQLTIHRGDTVVWINKGIVEHNVTEDSLETWTSGDINIGETWKMTPEESFHYFCSIHPTMKGVVSVVE